MNVCILFGVALVSFTAFGQTTESSLRAVYPQAPDGTFVVKPGVKIKATYGADRQVCVFTITGPISEAELMKTFETAVPAKSRGLKRQELVECAGGCERSIQFENVGFISGVLGTWQTSEPAAMIVFKGKDCEKAVVEAEKIVFHLKSEKPRPAK